MKSTTFLLLAMVALTTGCGPSPEEVGEQTKLSMQEKAKYR
jgi:hypothetical protein